MTTVAEAKQFLRENWDEGVECPCCHQFVKRQKRILYSSMAYVLILIYKEQKKIGMDEWVNVHQLMRNQKINVPDYTKFKFWDFLEAKIERRDDDSSRNGMWRITRKGVAFIKGQILAPKYFWVYNDKVFGASDQQVNIKEALGKKFDYMEMMGDVYPLPHQPAQEALL